MAENKTRKGGKKNRKHGRMTKWCQRYALSNRRNKNKVRRLRRHIARHPGDGTATACMKNLRA